jgi:hypothetical protein
LYHPDIETAGDGPLTTAKWAYFDKHKHIKPDFYYFNMEHNKVYRKRELKGATIQRGG